jgi:hypothetical protein
VHSRRALFFSGSNLPGRHAQHKGWVRWREDGVGVLTDSEDHKNGDYAIIATPQKTSRSRRKIPHRAAAPIPAQDLGGLSCWAKHGVSGNHPGDRSGAGCFPKTPHYVHNPHPNSGGPVFPSVSYVRIALTRTQLAIGKCPSRNCDSMQQRLNNRPEFHTAET